MNKSIFLSLAAFSALAITPLAAEDSTAISGEYTAESGHRYITFSYDHQGYSRPQLRWRAWDATLNWNAEDPASSSVSVTIDVASIDSGVDVFDEHLKGDNWFDVEAHPQATFVSTAAAIVEDHSGTVTGDLTIKGVTKPVTLDVEFHKGAFEERGNAYKIGFSGTTKINRSDFELGAYVPLVGDEVDIVISAEFQLPKAE